MEDPTRIYAIPTSAYSIPRYQAMNGTQSRINLVEVNSRRSLFKRRDFYRNTTVLLCFLIILLLLGFAIITLYYIRSNEALTIAKRVCLTEECLRSASNLRLSMDESVDPCDDFYEFSCGHWSEEHPNHGWYPKFSTFQSIEEKVLIASLNFLKINSSADDPKPVKQSRDFYKSCLDVDAQDALGYSVIYTYLKEVGLPLVPTFFKDEAETNDFVFDWLKVSVNLKLIFALNIFIQFDIDSDIFNRSNYVLYVGSGVSNSPLPSPFYTKQNKKPLVDRYTRNYKKTDEDEDDNDVHKSDINERAMKAMKEIFRVVIGNVSKIPDESVLEKAVISIMNVTDDIVEMIAANLTELDDLSLIKLKVIELQKITDDFLESKNLPKFPLWRPYIELLFNASNNVTFNFEEDLLYISKPELDFLCNMVYYILKTPDVVLELYNWWIVIKSMIISTTSYIVEYINNQNPASNNYPEYARSLALECSSMVSSYMGIAISYGIADKTFPNSTTPKVERMLDDIKDAFDQQVNSLPWMDKATKEATLEKSKNMLSFVGYPEWLLNRTAVEIYYSNITLTSKTYLENLMQFVKLITPSALDTYKHENTKTWRSDPTSVNAYNYFSDNSIIVPMAILAFPMYNLGLEVLNYGAIGTILGHELTHGFDNSGRKYDKDGNYIQWWSNDTIETFEEKSECFVSQYGGFKVDTLNKNIDGKNTLGENLADNGGLHHAYSAYQNYLRKYGEELRLPGFEKYTANQLFFIAFGSIWCETRDLASLAEQLNDEHSPNPFRVLGTLQNSHEFAEAYKCPLGSKMNPNRTRCRIW